MQDTITKPLLKWYGENKRVLPWREKKNPYEIWVSEIMLQQPKVEAVKPFYERFMRELPNVAALAVCPEEKLLKLWEGLGYYNRVRNMQKAAQKIMEVYDGVFPADYEALKGLPGIGNYTAGAVASIAFCIPVPAVDGNVLRAMARLREDGEDILKQSVDKKEYDINVLEKAVDMIIVVKTVAGMVKIDIYCDGNMEVRETINCLESRSIHLLYQKVLKLFMEVTDEQ